MLALKKMSRELCHEYFMHFENDAAVFEDEKMCVQYHYSENKVERYFQRQRKEHRSFMQTFFVKIKEVFMCWKRMDLNL